ncbi:hypothetical protein [Prosthecobacter sp.]|uniref:hypothetical protein n=1 Tax=Prosthecobacter sp. TaxID=1965333 RepID=UPI003784D94F
MNLILLIHFAATWALVGLIWVVQVIIYPQFHRVTGEGFMPYHFAHCFRIGLVVAPLLLVEAVTAAWIVYHGCDLNFLLSVCLIPLIWLSTAALQAPLHLKLMRGFDADRCRRLNMTNWVRTIAWTARGVLVSLSVLQTPAA